MYAVSYPLHVVQMPGQQGRQVSRIPSLCQGASVIPGASLYSMITCTHVSRFRLLQLFRQINQTIGQAHRA